MRSRRLIAKIDVIYNRVADGVLVLQPLFPALLYLTVLTGSPPLLVSLIINLTPLVVRYHRQKVLVKPTIFDLPILIFMIGSIVGLIVAPDKQTSMGALISLFASVLVYYGITSNGNRGKHYWITLGASIIVISIVFAVWFFSQGQSRQYFFNQWAFDLFKSMPKIAGVSLGLNGIGLLFSSIIPVLLGSLLFDGTTTSRIWLASLVILLLSILFLSASTEGWIAFGISAFFAIVYWRKIAALFLIPLSAVLTGLALFYYSSTTWLQSSLDIQSILQRIDIWVKTIPLLSSFHSFLGLGLGNWAEVFNNFYYPGYTHMHNNYFQIYADMGVFGVISIFVGAVIFILTAHKILQSTDKGILKGLTIGLIGSFLGGIFFNMLDVTLNGLIVSHNSYIYLSVPIFWVWAALYVVLFQRMFPQHPPNIGNLLKG